MSHLRGGAVDVDEHDGVGIQRVAGVVELLQPSDSRAVEPLHRGRHHTAGDDRRNGVGGFSCGGEGTHQAVGDFGDRTQRDGGFGDDAERAFGPDQDAEEVGPFIIGAEGGLGPVG